MQIDNPYAVPAAALPDAAPAMAPATASLSTLFAPSAAKLALLCATTFGWYALYWFYRNWQAIRLISGRRRISPVWRSVFSLIWIFACFRALDRVAGPHRHGALGWGWPALAYVGLSLLWVSPSLLALLALYAWLPLLVVNRRLVRFKRARGLAARPQERFTRWTWAWLAIAGPPVLLVTSSVMVTTLMDLVRQWRVLQMLR
ncbi:MFS transporter permease [Xanthomonas sp. WHRI 7945]|nr:MFS transporter permease [Xanthomonas campestris pv. campestris]